MSKLTKAFKKLRKATGLPALTAGIAGRVVAAALTRGKSEKLAQQLAGVGEGIKIIKGAAKKKLGKAVAAQVVKASIKLPKLKITPISAVKASAMPGGAPISGGSTSSSASRGRKRISVVRPKRAKVARTAKPKAAKAPRKAKRSAPKGGLDLKALSASWKAAGKPGTWAGWIKANK